MSFQLFPEGSDLGVISYLEGEIVPKSRYIMTEGIRKMFMCSASSTQFCYR